MEATRALRHPHIITLLEGGAQHDIFYFLLEFCEGGNVATLMERRGGRLTLEEAGPIILQTLQGLAFAHKQGFVHRDIKPQNILLRGKEGFWSARLSDLGLAKNFEQAGFSGMTITGEKVGTFQFMPREQVTHYKRFKPVSDVWAMGATCYYILTGSFPRNHLDTLDQVAVILRGEIIPIHTRDQRISRPIAEVIDRSLADKVNDRYQHAGEMYEALKKVLST
jgi:eukaryotic-like serine/threonine-protein kinase